MKKIKSNNNNIVLTGNNISKLLNLFISSDITISNANRIDVKTLECSVDDNNLKKITALNLKNYEITYKSVGGKKKLKKILINRCGLIIGIILSILAMIFLNNRLINIKISGLNKYSKEEVTQEINNFGLGYFSPMDINLSDLESHLTNVFDFSFVSIISKGNTLIVKVKEEISDIKDKYLPITADYNMVVTSINVYAGYSTIKVGDILYKGDVIVYPYDIVDEEKIDVVPMAEIKGDIFFSSRYNFITEETITERTGKSKIIETNYFFGKNKVFHNSLDNPYSSYEIVKLEKNISSYFLPINISQTIAFETKEVTKTHNFDDEKENIIENLRKEVYSKVPENFIVDKEDIQISSTNYGNIVTIYLKSSVYLKYK